MSPQAWVPRRRSRKPLRYSAQELYLDEHKCFHRWTVFVSGKGNRQWGYCVRCGKLKRWHATQPKARRRTLP